MKDLHEIAKKYYLDKLVAHTYISYYNELFKHLNVKNMLEIGIGLGNHEYEVNLLVKNKYKSGNSLLCWKEYFSEAIIHGIDIYETDRFINDNRINTYICNQSSKEQLENLVSKTGSFDLIIDDGSHIYLDQKVSLETLIYHINPYGMYIIEDVFDKHLEKLINLDDFDERTKRYINENFEISYAKDEDTLTKYRTHILPEEFKDQNLIIFRRKIKVDIQLD